jgi:HEAT repeats
MRKRYRIAIIVLLAAIFGVVAWWKLCTPAEPSYQGRPLIVWLRIYDENPPSYIKTDEAVRNMGTNSIPFLLRLIQAKDSRLKLKFFELADKQSFINIPHTTANSLHHRAMIAFEALASRASNAVPQLNKIYSESTNETTLCDVAACLGSIGPAASNAIPVLLSRTAGRDTYVRTTAIWALGEIHDRSDEVVPVLTTRVHDADLLVSSEAAAALGKFGSNAWVAVPVLVEHLNDKSNRLRKDYFLNALKKIDPEAAANWERTAARDSTLNLKP